MTPPIPSRLFLDTCGGLTRVTYDYAEHGGAVGSTPLELTLPVGTIITNGFIDVITAPTSGGSATIALNFIGENTQAIKAATAIASYSGRVPITPGALQAPIIAASTTTNASATIGSAALFGSVNVGDAVSGTGIPSGTTVLTKTSSSALVLSANATATAGSGSEVNLTFSRLSALHNSVKLAEEAVLNITVATAALTAGKFDIYLQTFGG